jgi:hypothetical protein
MKSYSLIFFSTESNNLQKMAIFIKLGQGRRVAAFVEEKRRLFLSLYTL